MRVIFFIVRSELHLFGFISVSLNTLMSSWKAEKSYNLIFIIGMARLEDNLVVSAHLAATTAHAGLVWKHYRQPTA